MSTEVEPTALPAFPQERAASCPFDPPKAYLDWQQEPGLQKARLYDGSHAWVVTRYEDIRAALGDPRVSADGTRPDYPPIPRPPETDPDAHSFARMDDPRHAEHRRMLSHLFTVKRTAAMRPHIQELVDDALDRMIDKGRPADLVTDFALPVPSTVIALLLGVPEEDYDFFQTHSKAMLDLSIPVEENQAAQAALIGYLSDLVGRKEREPGEDVISQLLADRVATGELNRRQLLNMTLALLVAGHETTATMIALGTLTLLRHPDQLAVVRDSDDPRVVGRAVEELLRYLTIAENAVIRVAREDMTVGGQLVRAGEGLIFSIPAGNWDTALDSDIDSFDIGRPARAHLAFGYGVHQCLGQNLARVELQIALPTLLRRLPELRLAVPFEEVPFRKESVVFSLDRLPVTW